MALTQQTVRKATELSFGRGIIGAHHPFIGPEDENTFGNKLAQHTRILTKPNTADCGDERLTLGFANSDANAECLRQRIVPQLFGGLGLATTKALVAADAVFIHGSDSTDFWSAYQKVSSHLRAFGQEDGGHYDCGASNTVVASVQNVLPTDQLTSAVGDFIVLSSESRELLNEITKHKKDLLRGGFYNAWDPKAHVGHLSQNFPQNLAQLKVEEDETHGHHGRALYVIREPNQGFAKNAFVEDTNEQAFALTFYKMKEMAKMFSGSPREEHTILLAFIDDSLHVAAGLVRPDMPVFIADV